MKQETYLLTILMEECLELNNVIHTTIVENKNKLEKEFLEKWYHIETMFEMIFPNKMNTTPSHLDFEFLDNMELVAELGRNVSELGIIVSKSIRFGLNDHHPSTPNLTNTTHIENTYNICKKLMQTIINRHIVNAYLNKEDVKKEKKNKVLNYMEYSKSKGIINE